MDKMDQGFLTDPHRPKNSAPSDICKLFVASLNVAAETLENFGYNVGLECSSGFCSTSELESHRGSYSRLLLLNWMTVLLQETSVPGLWHFWSYFKLQIITHIKKLPLNTHIGLFLQRLVTSNVCTDLMLRFCEVQCIQKTNVWVVSQNMIFSSSFAGMMNYL